MDGLSYTLRCVRSVTSKISGSSPGQIKVLSFHEVPYNSFPSLRSFLEKLKKKYNFISPEEFHAFLKGKDEIPGLNILLAFDDGFISAKEAAEKILSTFDIKAFFFIPVGFIGIQGDWKQFALKKIFAGLLPSDMLKPEHAPMSWNDIEWLLSNNHSIGSHTVNHKKLSNLKNDELVYELSRSSEILKERLGIEVKDLAFPFGGIDSIDSNSMKVINDYYGYCFSGVRGLNCRTTNPLTILRDEVSFDYSPHFVQFIVENGLGWYYKNQAEYLNRIVSF